MSAHGYPRRSKRLREKGYPNLQEELTDESDKEKGATSDKAGGSEPSSDFEPSSVETSPVSTDSEDDALLLALQASTEELYTDDEILLFKRVVIGVVSFILLNHVLYIILMLLLNMSLDSWENYILFLAWAPAVWTQFVFFCLAVTLAWWLAVDIIWARVFGLSPNKGTYRHYYEPWVHPVKHLRGWLKLGLLFAAFFACVHYNVWSVVCQDMVIVFTQPWARNWGAQVYARLCAYGHEILPLFKR